MFRRALFISVAFYPFQIAHAQECSNLAAQIGRDYERYADSSQVEIIKKANLCSSHYESATSDQRAQIEASYKLFSGAASGSAEQIKALQDEKCENHFGSYWSSRVTSSELNRVSSVGADVLEDCLNSQSFRLIDYSTSGDGITAVFRYGGTDQIILNGVVITPDGIASCSALYGGASQSDLGKISGTKLNPNETLTLACTRTPYLVATNQKHYKGGVIGVSTNSDSPMLPLIEYYDPIISTSAADALSADVNALNEKIDAVRARIPFLGATGNARPGYNNTIWDAKCPDPTDTVIGGACNSGSGATPLQNFGPGPDPDPPHDPLKAWTCVWTNPVPLGGAQALCQKK